MWSTFAHLIALSVPLPLPFPLCPLLLCWLLVIGSEGYWAKRLQTAILTILARFFGPAAQIIDVSVYRFHGRFHELSVFRQQFIGDQPSAFLQASPLKTPLLDAIA
jgi:hypothetical protein